MSDQQVIQHPISAAAAVGAGWLPIVETADGDETVLFCGLLKTADIPYAIDQGHTFKEGEVDRAGIMTLSVHECHYERACEIIARNHAESFDGTDDDGDEYFDDDDDDPDADLDDDDDDVFFDDDLDDDFDDDDDEDDDDDLLDNDPDDI